MDNKEFSITFANKPGLELSFKLAFMNEYMKDNETPTAKATHYADHPELGLIFFWAEDKSYNSIPLLTSLNWQEAANLAWTWLSNLPEERYGEYPNIDGSASKGYTVHNERISTGWHYGIVAVKAVWALHGK